MATAVERCDYSDLLPDECAHCTGANDLDDLLVAVNAVPDRRPIRWEGTWAEAEFAGRCGCGDCCDRIEPGDDITLAHGGPRGRDQDAWCLLEHTRISEVDARWH